MSLQRKRIFLLVDMSRRADVVCLDVSAERWGAGIALSLPGGSSYGFRSVWRGALGHWRKREWMFSVSIGPLAGYLRALRSRRLGGRPK